MTTEQTAFIRAVSEYLTRDMDAKLVLIQYGPTTDSLTWARAFSAIGVPAYATPEQVEAALVRLFTAKEAE